MIELTPEQAKAAAEQNEPVRLANPETREVFVLIRQHVYEITGKILSKWNDPDDDDSIECAPCNAVVKLTANKTQ